MDQYNRINKGIAYNEVVAVMGFEGAKFSSRRYGWTFTENYRWDSPWGPSVEVVFQQGRMIEKRQVGLK